MDIQTKKTLDKLHKRAQKNALGILWTLPKILMQKLYPKDMEHLFISITKKQGQYLYDTIIENDCKYIVEFGTSFGLSTIYLAAAAKQTGGKVITTEIVASKAAQARKNFEDAGVSEYIDVLEGDALDLLQNIDKSVDFVFMDGWKVLYLPIIKSLEPKLKKECIVIADNVDFMNTKEYLKYVRNSEFYISDYVSQFGRTTEKSVWQG